MTERDELVSRAIASLLGPQKGSDEVLPRDCDPRAEYITGILQPKGSGQGAVASDADADADLIGDDSEAGDDEDDEVFALPAFSVAPALDPRSLPSSIGVSFVIESDAVPSIRVCATYARYFEEEDGSWHRSPYCLLTGVIAIQDGMIVNGPGSVELYLRCSPFGGNPAHRRITAYLINVAALAQPEASPPTQSLVFQPEMRIVVEGGSRCVTILRHAVRDTDDPVQREDESLDLLYYDRPVLARGHMCAAVWKDIDPQRPGDNGIASPFIWTDEGTLPTLERSRFRVPDIRTEIVPLYSVPSPEMAWNGQFGPPPLLDPRELAEAWDGEALGEALRPLADGYRAWISSQEAAAQSLPVQMRSAADRHLGLCSESRRRIDAAIDLLSTNDEVRLAFCLANRAIAMQSEWRDGAGALRWRPFQLAFILLCIPGIADPHHEDRTVCDLLWFATGGGKTEAYLGVAAFTIALRRLRSERDDEDLRSDTGVGAITRYTLRLLTIQQFRRTLGMITACELLRVYQCGDGTIGWRPESCRLTDQYIWGTGRLSAGLWVGGNVTPNRFQDTAWPDPIPGALSLLRRHDIGHGEPAQVISCPACNSVLAIAQPRHPRQEQAAFPPGSSGLIHLVAYTEASLNPSPANLCDTHMQVNSVQVTPLAAQYYYVLSISFTAVGEGVSALDVDRWWKDVASPALGPWVALQAARASRPGYFIRTYRNQQRNDTPYDFDVYCPAPRCPLAQHQWREKVPVPIQAIAAPPSRSWQSVASPFQAADDTTTGCRVPIPAYTVDEQIYAHAPSLLVATVDKFARIAFDPRAASIFGYATHYHARIGYYRAGAPGNGVQPGADHPRVPALARTVGRFAPPDLILQDELHLIDGPLGSMVGLYETAIDALCESNDGRHTWRPKYIASTATVRQATEQVRALFCRDLAQFPPPGLSATDSFFSRTREPHPADAVSGSAAGRLYLGVCAPGKGAQTPITRIWATLMQSIHEMRAAGLNDRASDRYWTLVAYFNAIRELAGASGLYRQDIPQWMRHIAQSAPRPLREPLELSSRVDALQLPSLLTQMGTELPDDAVDATLTTSMFGTGVDVSRLGLMVVHGQPKTSSSYIQATGRVGRNRSGLVAAFLRASRPRDLDHYEFFTGFHRQLYRAVEPVTVAPFSPRARDRAMGPICVALLRQAEQILGQPVSPGFLREQIGQGTVVSGSQLMYAQRNDPAVQALKASIEGRSQLQPENRRPGSGETALEVQSEISRWVSLAQQYPGNAGLMYNEYSEISPPTHPVILGDAQHQRRRLPVAYEDAPQSLRDVEATTGFQI
ncbi:MAG TPA: DISARM system helicase DrmA [Capsulimonadaceae bacterium]